MAWRPHSYLWCSLSTPMEKWALEARLWGLVVRGSGINQPELRSPWNQKSSEHRMSANEHGPTKLQVYRKSAKLNCFCRQSCDLRWGMQREGAEPCGKWAWRFPIIASLLGAEAGLSGVAWEEMWLLDRDCVSTTHESPLRELCVESGCPICIKYDFQQLRLQCLDPAAH